MKNVNEMPSPADLAKKSKEETRNISLRVKETTMGVFDVLAEKEKTTPTTLILNLLDFYTENYKKSQDPERLSTEIMRNYLNKNAEKIAKNDEQDNLCRLLRKGTPDCLSGTDFSDITDPVELDLHLKDENVNGINAQFGGHCGLIVGRISNSEKSHFGLDSPEDDDYRDYYLALPREKWIPCVTMLNDFEKKMEQLFPGSTFMTEPMAKKIADAALKNDDKLKMLKAMSSVMMEAVEMLAEE